MKATNQAELGEEAVAGGLDDAAVVSVDLGTDHLTVMRLEPRQRSLLVRAHQA
jgi:hypothetical protein